MQSWHRARTVSHRSGAVPLQSLIQHAFKINIPSITRQSRRINFGPLRLLSLDRDKDA